MTPLTLSLFLPVGVKDPRRTVTSSEAEMEPIRYESDEATLESDRRDEVSEFLGTAPTSFVVLTDPTDELPF